MIPFKECTYINCVFVLCPLLFPNSGGRKWALSSACKTDRADFTVGSSSFHLTSWRKSALIQKSSTQIPKAFHAPGNAERTII